jgi:hypothetical protein
MNYKHKSSIPQFIFAFPSKKVRKNGGNDPKKLENREKKHGIASDFLAPSDGIFFRSKAQKVAFKLAKIEFHH